MAEKVSSEFGRRQKNRREKGERERDGPEEPPSYKPLIGFDLDCSSFEPIESSWGNEYDVALFARLGLHCHNFQKGTNFKFNRSEKYCLTSTNSALFYITLEATDLASRSVVSFQTLLSDWGCKVRLNVGNSWTTLATRIKGDDDELDDEWDEDAEAIPKLYKGPMPEWFSDEALARKYYVVQESELHGNDWLQLLMELAFYSKADRILGASPPLEIKNVVIETQEEDTTAAENAIFYLSYKSDADPWAGDHQAIIRKTMDGKPGHMRIEVADTVIPKNKKKKPGHMRIPEKMPKNMGKGGKKKKKKRGKNEADDDKGDLIFKKDGQEYARIITMLGNERCQVRCIDGVKRLCHICDSMHKTVWDDIVLVGLRDFQDEKADVIFKYTSEEARRLKTYEEIPWDFRLNEEKMPKNMGKGGKKKKRGKNEADDDDDDDKLDLIFKKDGQEYARVIRMLGNGRCQVRCIDGVKRLCHICDSMHKTVWIADGDIVLVGLRDFQDEKADVIFTYTSEEARSLKAYGQLPKNFRVDGEIDFDDLINFEDG